MKIKTIKIRVEGDAKDYDLDDFLKTENYSVKQAFASLQNDEDGKFWEVLVFYDFNSNQMVNRSIKSELYEELKFWVERKAKDFGITLQDVEERSRVYEFAKDYLDYTLKADFLTHRNYGSKKFNDYGKEILEIFRKYQ